ncbi:DUF4214 domain-containing protein [Noviherbaspirillum sp. ST9]|uniref:DUF4214 domain-containing protein n=1 Tax=Noviherbaspirillum sp. ST9 TaxID=3401606 RepID=UPI003B585F99
MQNRLMSTDTLRSTLVPCLSLALISSVVAGCGGDTSTHSTIATSSAAPATAQFAPLADTLASPRTWQEDLAVEPATESTPGQVYRLYRAAFDREPDTQGLGFHIASIENQGISLQQVAANFIASPEFSSRYGKLGASAFVTQLYANVLKRAPDDAGLKFHVDNINSGTVSTADVLLGFSESPENKAATSTALQAGVRFLPNDVLASDATAACTGKDQDALGGVAFQTVHPIGEKAWGCRVVTGPSFPVLSGSRSVRFEVNPTDCSGNEGFNDCTNDRSRHEIITANALGDGRVVNYESSLYIPTQAKFRPKGDNKLFLNQVNSTSATQFGTLAYLEVGSDGDLYVRTQPAGTQSPLNLYPIYKSPQGKWIKVRYEVKVTPDATSGYLKVYVDDKLVITENRATVPDAASFANFRIGIYNGIKSLAQEPYAKQIVYFDGVNVK